MQQRTRAQALTLAWALLVPAASAGPFAHDLITTKVTWTRDISRLVQTRCIGCHGPGASMPVLTTYEQARPWAKAIREEVLTRRMPKWNAVRGYGDFANDPSLSPFEIAMVTSWVDGGAPKGTGGEKEQGTRDKGEATRETGNPGRPGIKPTRPAANQVTLPCSDQPLSGRLLAVNPHLQKGGGAGIAALLPNGRREIVAWIRNYEPEWATTYVLRTPLVLPKGSRLKVEASGDCSVVATLAR